MKHILLILAAALMLSIGCGSKQSNKQMDMKDKKALVVYFSHAGENYAVGNIPVGNTKVIAEYISELTGADMYEITTHKYDSMSYKTCCDVAQEEQINDERPPFEGKIVPGAKNKEQARIIDNPTQADFDNYDVVFIGSPVWWGTYPQVMFSFFDTYDLNGKVICPFTTHEGSGLGNCVGDVRANYPHADMKKGFSIYGHNVGNGKADVEQWLKELGF